MRAPISITMDHKDFEQLAYTSTRWADDTGTNRWMEQADRFELHGDDTEINWTFRYVFWVGDEWVNVMFARAFLDSIGQPYQILWDMVENPDMSWVILTNYSTDVWLRAETAQTG